MRDGAVDGFGESLREDAGAVGICLECDPATFKVTGGVVGECDLAVRDWRLEITWEQAGFDEDLEAVADAENRIASLGEGVHLVVEMVLQVERPADASAEVVAVGEAARDDEHGVVHEAAFASQQLVDMHDFGVATCQFASDSGVAVAVGAVGVENQDFRLDDW